MRGSWLEGYEEYARASCAEHGLHPYEPDSGVDEKRIQTRSLSPRRDEQVSEYLFEPVRVGNKAQYATKYVVGEEELSTSVRGELLLRGQNQEMHGLIGCKGIPVV